MKVFIITEGGKDIGFGHITRCLSLYQAFEERRIKLKFIVNADNSIEGILINVNYKKFNWFKERNKIFKIIENADIVIIDSYLADVSFYKKLSELVKIAIYIDDNKRLDYPRGIVVNGNIYAKELDYPKRDGIVYFLGPKYIPLRKEFWEVPEKEIKEEIESIMVTFGGDDARNMTPKILRFLKKKYPKIKRNVIIGKSFNNIDEIKKEADYNTKLIYHPNAQKIKEIMLESDIAISAGGQTLYELARVGVPTIGICVVNNQLENIKEWDKIGFLEYAGLYNKRNIITKIDKLLKILENIKIRKSKSKIGRKFVDGQGAKRIIKYMLIRILGGLHASD